MTDRVGQLWALGEDLEWKHIATGVAAPKKFRILVTDSIDKGNGRTLQRYLYFNLDGTRGGSGEDTEYADLPWEMRKERRRLG